MEVWKTWTKYMTASLEEMPDDIPYKRKGNYDH